MSDKTSPRLSDATRPRILVVDDEPQIHRFLAPALEAAGYEPLRAETVAEGIALAAQLIDSGKAAAVLEKFIEVSNRPEENA